MHNLVEEQKTLKRSSSFAGKLANLSIGKSRSNSKRDAKKGLATLCIGGGMGVALAVER